MESSYYRSCDAQGNNCHCDLRLELMDCLDTYPASIILKLQVALSAAVTLAGEYFCCPSNTLENPLFLTVKLYDSMWYFDISAVISRSKAF